MCLEMLLLKVFKEVAERTASGRLFHTRAAATPNALSPTEQHPVCGMISLWVTWRASRRQTPNFWIALNICRKYVSSAAACKFLIGLELSRWNSFIIVKIPIFAQRNILPSQMQLLGPGHQLSTRLYWRISAELAYFDGYWILSKICRLQWR